MSRTQAAKSITFEELKRNLSKAGVELRAAGKRTAVEEAPLAYKDVSEVVDVVAGAGLAARVARMRPLGVVKG